LQNRIEALVKKLEPVAKLLLTSVEEHDLTRAF